MRSKTQLVEWPNSNEINSSDDVFWPRLLVLETAAFRSIFGDSDGRE